MAATGVATLLIGTTSLWAFCVSAIETYAIFQCAEQAYFAPVPSPFTPGDVTGVFWQIGFGNNTLNTGDGTSGTGVRSKKSFNGNDSGTFLVDLPDAEVTFPGTGFPAGSVCLGSNNWANAGIDGCCDNPRYNGPFLYYNQYNYFGYYQYYYGGYAYASDDHILNPYYGTYVASTGRPGFYSLGSMMDYPTAVLLKTPDLKFFAIAAVTNVDRGNDGTSNNGATGDPNTAGTNPGPNDIGSGFFSFADVTNGTANVITGLNNVIPWQSTPEPIVDANSIVGDPNDPNATLTFDVSWSAPVIHSDGRSVPSNNPTMAPADPNSADGPGVADIDAKFGLVRYQFEYAAENDPGFTTITQTVTCPGAAECTSATSATLQAGATECVRINTLFGTPPRETSLTNATICRVGKCGDVGFGVLSDRFCPGSATCFPSPEICDGLDNDCDNVPDNGFNLGQGCNGVGECGAGVFECHPVDPNFAICSTDPGGSGDQSAAEFCDGLDNDCDASTDEDFTLGQACAGTGECANDPNGVTECSAADPNTTQCSTDPGGSRDQSTTELCDALDNDCDASTDEDFTLGQACTGTGECGAGIEWVHGPIHGGAV
jgi:hypothetical protein